MRSLLTFLAQLLLVIAQVIGQCLALSLRLTCAIVFYLYLITLRVVIFDR